MLHLALRSWLDREVKERAHSVPSIKVTHLWVQSPRSFVLQPTLHWVLLELSKLPSQRSALRPHHFIPVEHPAGINLWVRYHFLIYWEMQKTGTPCPAHVRWVGSGLWVPCDCFMLMFLHSALIGCFAPAKTTTKGQKPTLFFFQFFLGLPTAQLNPDTASTVPLRCFIFCHQLWSTSAKTL